MLRRLMKQVVAPAAWAVLVAVIAPVVLCAQTANSRSAGDPNAWSHSLSVDAQRAAEPAGDLNYATELIGMMKPYVSQGDFARLARRLASADQAARHDSRKYISETAVAAAFNRLMAPVPHNNATPFSTDAQTVHNMRWILAGNSPALTSVKEHPASSLPDEAVLLVSLLILNNGRLATVAPGQTLLSAENAMLAEEAADDAQVKLDQYLAGHWKWTNMAIFSKLLGDMGI